ncbi:MAG: type II secretion system protein [Planctomycetes bacterium]|nr:type II secretion system protein [Planctomycetota bacterium]
MKTWKYQVYKGSKDEKLRRGFTLVEILVVISIISVLTGILLPVLGRVRQQARQILGMDNQRQIVGAVNCFELDFDGSYPESVATIGVLSKNWGWWEPATLTGNRKKSPQIHRAMSEYLGEYIKDAKTMFCPNAPRRYKYLQEAWDAGDNWDNPDEGGSTDPVIGTYCFYWNYIGFLEGRSSLFRGPRNSLASRGESKLLVSDYFGYGHWRSLEFYGSLDFYSSCEKFNGASVTPETYASSAHWAVEKAKVGQPNIKLNAGYTDGHVESYSTSEVVPMKVSTSSDGTTPYLDGTGPGIIYIPENGLR